MSCVIIFAILPAALANTWGKPLRFRADGERKVKTRILLQRRPHFTPSGSRSFTAGTFKAVGVSDVHFTRNVSQRAQE